MDVSTFAGISPFIQETAEGPAVVFPTIEYESSRKAKLSWTIQVQLLCGKDKKFIPITPEVFDLPDLKDCQGVISVISKQIAVRKVVPTFVDKGKNLGKKNATNAFTQALREALSKYNKQQTKTSPATAHEETEDAAEKDLVAIKYPPPQLLKAMKSDNHPEGVELTSDDYEKGVVVQPKLNGVRYVTSVRGDKIVFYSRSGREYPTTNTPHIFSELKDMVQTAKQAVSQNDTQAESQNDILGWINKPFNLDGELYKHGLSLNVISGQARGAKVAGELEYHVYDIFFPDEIEKGIDIPYSMRAERLQMFFNTAAHPHIKMVQSYPAHSLQEIKTLTVRFLLENYEGAVARKNDAGYRYSIGNYHSSNVLKVKPLYDDEFPVIGFTEGKGKDTGAIIFICQVPLKDSLNPNDREFSVVPRDMTYEVRKQLFKCLSKKTDSNALDSNETIFDITLKGLPITVEYAERSAKTGKPLQPHAVAFRTYENGEDPFVAILNMCTE